MLAKYTYICYYIVTGKKESPEELENGTGKRKPSKEEIIMKRLSYEKDEKPRHLKGVETMMFVVRSETTEALCCGAKFDTLEDAREQMALWVEVDDDGESQDWADYILVVPDKDVEDAVHGHADTEKIVEGKCGNEYHGSHYWEM